MKREKITSGSVFESQIGYSRALVVGNWVFVSGTTGYNYEEMSISEDITEQTEACIKNIKAALEEAESGLEDIVRVKYILPDASQFELCWPILREHFGPIGPAATMIEAGLADKKMKIEIEVTALKA